MGCRLTSGREFAPPSKSTSARNGIVNAQPAPFILKIVVPQLCLYASRIAFDRYSIQDRPAPCRTASGLPSFFWYAEMQALATKSIWTPAGGRVDWRPMVTDE